MLMATPFARTWAQAEMPTVWGLLPASQFEVELTSNRQSSVQIDDHPPFQKTTIDQLNLRYQLLQVSPTGDGVFGVRLVRAVRQRDPDSDLEVAAAEHQIGQLQGAQFETKVGADGITEGLFGHRRLLNSLAGLDQSAAQVLQDSCSEDVIRSWLSYPFWMAGDARPVEQALTWDRIDHRSLGLMGSIRTAVTLTVKEVDGNTAQVLIEGRPRFVPAVVLPDAAAGAVQTMRFSDVVVSGESFTGTGTMQLAADSATPDDTSSPAPFPAFQKLNLKISYAGTASIESGNTRSKVAFQQAETITARLVGFRPPRPLSDPLFP
jgi:hypothetical protein